MTSSENPGPGADRGDLRPPRRRWRRIAFATALLLTGGILGAVLHHSAQAWPRGEAGPHGWVGGPPGMGRGGGRGRGGGGAHAPPARRACPADRGTPPLVQRVTVRPSRSIMRP